MINSTFGRNIFVQYFTNAMCLSTCIFEITIGKSVLLNKILLIIYSSAIMTELAFYCYFGEQISTEVNLNKTYLELLKICKIFFIF